MNFVNPCQDDLDTLGHIGGSWMTMCFQLDAIRYIVKTWELLRQSWERSFIISKHIYVVNASRRFHAIDISPCDCHNEPIQRFSLHKTSSETFEFQLCFTIFQIEETVLNIF